MLSLLALPVAISLLLYFVPSLLHKRKRYQHSSEYLVSAEGTTDDVFQNASLAYALQLATFGPFFVWGLRGDWIPAVLNSAFFGCGLLFLVVFRRDIASFVGRALSNDSSVTIHEFLARTHGNDPGLRLTASALTIVALWGIAMSEMLGIAAAVTPFLGGNIDMTFLFVIALLLLMFGYSTLGGNDGVMRTDQLQLAVGYLGIFGSMIGLVLVLSASPQAVRASLPIVFLGLFASFWLIARRGAFTTTSADVAAHPSQGATWWRWYLRTEKALGQLVVVAVLVILFSVMWFAVVVGPRTLVTGVRSSMTTSTSMSPIALFALALLPLGYQLVDITNWQRFAAVGTPAGPYHGPRRTTLLLYAFEAPMVWVFLLAFGTIAASVGNRLEASPNPFGDFIAQLAGADSLILRTAAVFLLTGVFAIGLSTMDAVFSATMCAFQYDILPALTERRSITTSSQIAWSKRFGFSTYFIVVALFYITSRYFAFGSDNYVALLLAFYSAQISFVPLVLGALISGRRGHRGSPVGTAVAIASLLAGSAVGIAATVSGIIRSEEVLLWTAIPLSIGLSAAIYACGWFSSTRKQGGREPR